MGFDELGMKPVTLAALTDVTRGRYFGDTAALGRAITGVVTDSRDAFEGCLFVCVKGERADGHDFCGAAAAAGAVCALAERVPPPGSVRSYILVESALSALRAFGEYYRGLFSIPVIGVTGSVGKTTVKEMTAAVLGTRFNVHKTHMNLNNEIGVPLTLLSMREEHTAAVIEMGISDFGEMDRLARMALPTVCVVTAIGYCHLDTLGGLDGVLRAKSEVFRRMTPDGAAVLNGDDETLRGFSPGVRTVVTYGFGPRCDFRAENVTPRGTDGVSCDIVFSCDPLGVSGRFGAEIPAFGEHFAQAALAACAVGKLLGLSDGEIARGLLAYKPVAGRANVINTGRITVIDDCYNANPNSVSAALKALCSLPGRRVAVLGDMNELGYRSEELHRETGNLAARLGLDCLICCGERAEWIYKGFIAGGGGPESYHFPFMDALLLRLPGLVRDGDAVLVKASHSHRFDKIADELTRF
jgi:UDP-N-acetylmuramoyl-tripeptide--D-alanyl-D-alanine ligase